MQDLLNINFGITTLKEGVLTCSKCGDTMNSPKKPRSLQTHIATITGFVEYHNKNCKIFKTSGKIYY